MAEIDSGKVWAKGWEAIFSTSLVRHVSKVLAKKTFFEATGLFKKQEIFETISLSKKPRNFDLDNLDSDDAIQIIQAKTARSRNRVVLIDLDSVAGVKDRMELPFVPRELSINPNNSLVPVGSIGRNNPFYNYTGSEDTLEFTIDWYSMDDKRDLAIEGCKWLVAISKNDGYVSSPHRILIVWGDGGWLFGEEEWLIEKAPYRLNNFSSGYINTKKHFVNDHLLPLQAYQRVTLKKVTQSNLSHADLIWNKDLGFDQINRRGITEISGGAGEPTIIQ